MSETIFLAIRLLGTCILLWTETYVCGYRREEEK